MTRQNDALRLTLMVMTVIGVAVIATDAMAVTAPTSGNFAYDVYDIFVTKMLKGPIGFVAGCTAIVFGAVKAIQAQILPAAAAVIGGGFLLKADSVITSLGAVMM